MPITHNFLTRSQNHVFNRTDTKIVHVVPELVVPLTVLSKIARDFYFFRYAIRSEFFPPIDQLFKRERSARRIESLTGSTAVPLIKNRSELDRPPAWVCEVNQRSTIFKGTFHSYYTVFKGTVHTFVTLALKE